MQDKALQYIAAVTVGLLAVGLVWGSVFGWLIGREIPAWLTLADGAIITGAFGTGAFFAQARAAEPTSQRLAALGSMYHELAMAGMTASTPAVPQVIPRSGTAGPAGSPNENPGGSGTDAHTEGGG